MNSTQEVRRHLADREFAKRVRERFFARANPSENGCWEWSGSRKQKDGRAYMDVAGRSLSGGRLAWWIQHGELPSDHLFACHSCDNPGCVNPDHIWLGTPLDNARDCADKDRRGASGAGVPRIALRDGRHPRATIDASKAAEVKWWLSRGKKPMHVASATGVSRTVVRNIKAGKCWRYVAPALP